LSIETYLSSHSGGLGWAGKWVTLAVEEVPAVSLGRPAKHTVLSELPSGRHMPTPMLYS